MAAASGCPTTRRQAACSASRFRFGHRRSRASRPTHCSAEVAREIPVLVGRSSRPACRRRSRPPLLLGMPAIAHSGVAVRGLPFPMMVASTAVTSASGQCAHAAKEDDQERGDAMSRLIAMLLTGFLTLPPVSGSPVASMQDGVAVDPVAALRTFNERIGEYAALHRRLEGP